MHPSLAAFPRPSVLTLEDTASAVVHVLAVPQHAGSTFVRFAMRCCVFDFLSEGWGAPSVWMSNPPKKNVCGAHSLAVGYIAGIRCPSVNSTKESCWLEPLRQMISSKRKRNKYKDRMLKQFVQTSNLEAAFLRMNKNVFLYIYIYVYVYVYIYIWIYIYICICNYTED